MTDNEKEIFNKGLKTFMDEFISEGNKRKYLRHTFIKNTCEEIYNKLSYKINEINDIKKCKLSEDRNFKHGDIVMHFKREIYTGNDPLYYIYVIDDICVHTETRELMVVYHLLYEPEGNTPFHKGSKVCRPYDMFMSEVDHKKYPDIKQKYRFEKYIPDVNINNSYKTKPCKIEAIQWTDNTHEIIEFCNGNADYNVLDTAWEVGKGIPKETLTIHTLEGDMVASRNDYIIKDAKGNYYLCKSELFNIIWEVI